MLRRNEMAELPIHPVPLPTNDGQVWPAQGRWTYEDYRRLPDDRRRYEVIRGFLYASSEFSFAHQYSLTRLVCFLIDWVRESRLGVVLAAPFDVRLPQRIGDPVQPDIVFIRHEHQPKSGALWFGGIPGLVVEVLSSETWRVDQEIKLSAYRDAGIPETWLVDPMTQTVEVYVLDPVRAEYVLREKRGEGETAGSAVLPGLRLEVAEIFPPD